MNPNDSVESEVAERSPGRDGRIWTVILVAISLVTFYLLRDLPEEIMAKWHQAAARGAETAAHYAEAAADDAENRAIAAIQSQQREQAAAYKDEAIAQREKAAKEWIRAFTEIDKAISRHPSGPMYASRSRIHQTKGVLERAHGNFDEARSSFELALADINTAIELGSTWEFYAQRASIHEMLDQFEEAVEDITIYLQTFPEMLPPAKADAIYANNLNSRAYMRALGRFEIAEGLVDIDKALRILPEDAANRYTFLDTQAYLLHLDGESEKALPIIERCVADAQAALENASSAELPEATESLAVLIHHRGEIYEAIGEENAAAADYKKAIELGFDPRRGVR